MKQKRRFLLYTSFFRLTGVYLVSVLLSFVVGLVGINYFKVSAEAVFKASSSRISHVVPLLNAGIELGLDQGMILFLWNSVVALITISFFYAYPLFDPDKIALFPRTLRKIFIGREPMKFLCYLPGCRKIEAEHLKRLYVWLMVPMLGMVLLGVETGMMIAAGKASFNSYLASVMAFLPHGIIEIPAISLAGTVAFSGHLLVKKHASVSNSNQVFNKLDQYKSQLSVKKIIITVIAGLGIAGFLEAHVTTLVIQYFYQIV